MEASKKDNFLERMENGRLVKKNRDPVNFIARVSMKHMNKGQSTSLDLCVLHVCLLESYFIVKFATQTNIFRTKLNEWE